MNDERPTEASSAPVPRKPSRWGQERRLAFIDFRLSWEGRLNRSDLTDFFSISVPQASIDIAKYQELKPDNMWYDRKSRVYQVTEDFRPLYQVEHQSKRYLNELLAVRSGDISPDISFIGWHPSVDSVPRPGRQVREETLIAILKAMRESSGLTVVYQSFSSSNPEPVTRTISPHALGFDGFRWHARAYCHLRNAYRDFVLGRILEIQGEEPRGCPELEDVEWANELTLVLEPHPSLSEAQRRGIECDYGMVDGQLELKCRQALLFYAIRELRLDDEAIGPPRVHVSLKNREELKPYLPNDAAS